MSNILVIGGGMVGGVIARDLSEKFDVTVADVSNTRLKLLKKRHPSLTTMELDVADLEAVKNAVN
ncbi:MAG: saccharopine dehydrogenase NADP-binding domain-containing protein, partial [Kangiella sp.]|nr:saccharopine dehydrogenase NADP-binding domain-containing protein [Kangiella sp.]